MHCTPKKTSKVTFILLQLTNYSADYSLKFSEISPDTILSY